MGSEADLTLMTKNQLDQIAKRASEVSAVPTLYSGIHCSLAGLGQHEHEISIWLDFLIVLLQLGHEAEQLAKEVRNPAEVTQQLQTAEAMFGQALAIRRLIHPTDDHSSVAGRCTRCACRW